MHQRKTKHFIAKLYPQPFILLQIFLILVHAVLFTVRILGASSYETRRANATASILVFIGLVLGPQKYQKIARMYDRAGLRMKCTLIKNSFKNLCTGMEAKFRPFDDSLHCFPFPNSLLSSTPYENSN